MGLYKQIVTEKKSIDQIITEIQSHGYLMLKGRLRCTKCSKHDQYYIDGKYVKQSDLERARLLAKRDYEKKLLPLLLTMSKRLGELQHVYETDKLHKAYSDLCEGRKHLLVPYFVEKEQYIEQWVSKEYDHWEISEQTKGNIYTNKGERVRSKSEKIIADELTRFHIPYRYEFPLELTDGNRKRIIRPDFLVLNRRTLKEYMIEHMGMMDKMDYYNRSLDKLDLYEKNGYLIGRNLLLFHEAADSPLNMTVLEKYIKEFLL